MAPSNESEEEQKPQKHALDTTIRRSTRIRRSRFKSAEPINVHDTKFKRGKRWTIQEKQLLLRALKERGAVSQFDYTAIRREVKTRKKAEVQCYLTNLRKRAIRYRIEAVKRQSPIEIWNALMKDSGDSERECIRVMSKTIVMAGMELTTFPDRLAMDDFRPIKIYRYLASLLNGRDLPQVSPLECQIILDCFENLLEVLKGNEIKEQAAFLQSQYFKLYEKAYIGDWAFRQERILNVYATNQSESGNSKSSQSGTGSSQVGNSDGSGTGRATEEERCRRGDFHHLQETRLLNPLILPVDLLDFKPLELHNKKKALTRKKRQDTDDIGIATSSEDDDDDDDDEENDENDENDEEDGGGSDEMAMENDIEKPNVNESNGHADDGSLTDILEVQNESPHQDCRNKNGESETGRAADLSTRNQLESASEKVSESDTSNQGTEHVSSLQPPPLITIPAPVPDDNSPNATPRSYNIIDLIPCGKTFSLGSQSGTSILAGNQSCSILQVKTPTQKDIIDNSVSKYPERSNVPGEDSVTSNVNSKGPRKTKLKLKHRAKKEKVPKQRETVVDLLKKLRSDSLQSVNPFVPGSIVGPVAGVVTESAGRSVAGAVTASTVGSIAGPVPGAVAGQLLTLDLSQLGQHSNIVIPSSVLPGGIITIRSPEKLNTGSVLPGIGATPTNVQAQGIAMLGKQSATGCLQASPVVESTAPATQTYKAMASITKIASGIQPNQTGNSSSFTTQSRSCMPPDKTDVSNIPKNPVSPSVIQSQSGIHSYHQMNQLDVSSSLVVQSQHPDPSMSQTIASNLQMSQSMGNPSVTVQPTYSIPLGNQASTSVASPSELVQSKRRNARGPVKLAFTSSEKKSKSHPAVPQVENEHVAILNTQILTAGQTESGAESNVTVNRKKGRPPTRKVDEIDKHLKIKVVPPTQSEALVALNIPSGLSMNSSSESTDNQLANEQSNTGIAVGSQSQTSESPLFGTAIVCSPRTTQRLTASANDERYTPLRNEADKESTSAGSGSGNSSTTECQSGSQRKKLPLFFSLKKTK